MRSASGSPGALFFVVRIIEWISKNLIIEGLEVVLRAEIPAEPPADALTRLRQGYHLGGQPLTRDQAHAR